MIPGLKKFQILFMLALFYGFVPALRASATGDLKDLTPDDFKRLYADSWRAVGRNIII